MENPVPYSARLGVKAWVRKHSRQSLNPSNLRKYWIEKKIKIKVGFSTVSYFNIVMIQIKCIPAGRPKSFHRPKLLNVPHKEFVWYTCQVGFWNNDITTKDFIWNLYYLKTTFALRVEALVCGHDKWFGPRIWKFRIHILHIWP